MAQRLQPHTTTVSIHTSTWEVTFLSSPSILPHGVSIHTSTWEVTFLRESNHLQKFGFNPHLHVGGDEDELWRVCDSHVSIHTSTWEVTKHYWTNGQERRFNPPLHVGGDVI